MPAKSSNASYGAVAISIHWLTALLILSLFVLGFRAAATEDPTVKLQLLSLHVPLGWSVFILTIGRIAWWAFADRKPAPATNTPQWQERIAKLVHVLLYVAVIGTFIAGSATLVTSGAVDAIMNKSPDDIPNFSEFAASQFHGAGARVMLVLLALHVGAAFYHQFLLRDGLISRMWFSSK